MLSNRLLEELKQRAPVMVIPKNTVIIDFEKYIKQIPVITRGSVKVTTSDDSGREVTLYHIKPGESCVSSILSAFTNSKSKIQATTLDETEIILLPITVAQDLIKQKPEWFEFIMKLYQMRFEELLQAVTHIGFVNLDQRIVKLLNDKSKLTQTKFLNITHQEIANELGASRESISRSMKKLEEEGLLTQSRGKISLLK